MSYADALDDLVRAAAEVDIAVTLDHHARKAEGRLPGPSAKFDTSGEKLISSHVIDLRVAAALHRLWATIPAIQRRRGAARKRTLVHRRGNGGSQ